MSTATRHEKALDEVLSATALHAEHTDAAAEFPTAALDAMRATGISACWCRRNMAAVAAASATLST
ncbi:hypothetical protein [Salinispora arenicola]|uniref:hypothetical protein n=1 Tax=Salinispora arenicola TaxID=168697 RepID=UPI0027DC3A1F|nr:hypothetical protein [Salinispora arenicola]